MNENMNENMHEKSLLESVRSMLVDFSAKPILLETLAPTELVESRDVHQSWSLYGNVGSYQGQSVTVFGPKDTEHYGSEGWPQNTIGTSHAQFTEGLQLFNANGSATLASGVTQKVSGQIAVMLSGLQLTSGKAKKVDGHDEFYDTAASAEYYITLTIRRQRQDGKKFHLYVQPIMHGFTVGGDVGQHTLRVFDDSTSVLLQQQDLVLSTDPRQNALTLWEVSDLLTGNNFLRVEVIAQIALANKNSPKDPVFGGSFCGIGFLDNVT